MKAMVSLLTFTLFLSPDQSQSTLASDIFVEGFTSISDSTTTVAEHFNKLAQTWMHAYNNNDSTTLVALYTPDAEDISSHVQDLVANGHDRVIANFQRGIESGGHINSISVFSVQLSCDLATLLCKYEATNSGKKAVGRSLIVVKKVNDRWLIRLHMTVV